MRDDLKIRDVSIREMLEAMRDQPDDAVFRWYQASVVNDRGEPTSTATLRLTVGQVRRELG